MTVTGSEIKKDYDLKIFSEGNFADHALKNNISVLITVIAIICIILLLYVIVFVSKRNWLIAHNKEVKLYNEKEIRSLKLFFCPSKLKEMRKELENEAAGKYLR